MSLIIFHRKYDLLYLCYMLTQNHGISFWLNHRLAKQKLGPFRDVEEIPSEQEQHVLTPFTAPSNQWYVYIGGGLKVTGFSL